MNMHYIPRQGDVVAASRGVYEHVGIYAGEGTVISCSGRAGCVVAESTAEFGRGSPVRLAGYPGNLPRHVVVERAWDQLGRPYSLFSNNCEHFVARVHGLAPRSPQLIGLGTVAVGMALAAGWE